MAKKNSVRVVIPKNPDDFLKLAALVYAKHLADDAASKLNSLEDFNWTDNGSKIDTAQQLQVQIKQLERDLESLYDVRDNLIEPVDKTVKASRDLLLGVYQNNPKRLGDWGFEVNDTPQKPKKPTP